MHPDVRTAIDHSDSPGRKSRWSEAGALAKQLTAALDDVRRGVQSPLELRYLRLVERAHRLPRGARQVRHQRRGGHIYDDVLYGDFGLVVELDGRAAHPVEQIGRDLIRDNVAAARGDSVLHYGWDLAAGEPCRVAAEVAAALRKRGWRGTARPCKRESCMIADSSESHSRETARDLEVPAIRDTERRPKS